MRLRLLALAAVASLLQPASAGEPQRAVPERVTFTLQYSVVPQGFTREFRLLVLLPRTLEGRQKVLNVQYSLPPQRVFDQDGDHYAAFVVPNLVAPGQITIGVEAEVYPYDLATAQSAKATVAKESPESLKRWLKDEPGLEKTRLGVLLAGRIPGEGDLDVAQAVMDFVARSLRYSGYNQKIGRMGAFTALQIGHGKCSEFSDLFVALCRAKGVPARVWGGYLLGPVREGNTPKHSWAEVYTKKYGWVPFDPLHIALGGSSFDRIRESRVYYSTTRNNPLLHGGALGYWRYKGQPVQVQETFAIHELKPLPEGRGHDPELPARR
jgi:hypothetical protein